MTTHPLPDWATPGADVAEVDRRRNVLSIATIADTTATGLIVLDNNSRYRQQSHNNEVERVGEGLWIASRLYPLTAPIVTNCLAATAFRDLARLARQKAKLITFGTSAGDILATLAEVIAEATAARDRITRMINAVAAVEPRLYTSNAGIGWQCPTCNTTWSGPKDGHQCTGPTP